MNKCYWCNKQLPDDCLETRHKRLLYWCSYEHIAKHLEVNTDLTDINVFNAGDFVGKLSELKSAKVVENFSTEKLKDRNTLPFEWVVTIDGVIIPQTEYNWTEDGNFYFPKTMFELAQTYCTIHKKYKLGDEVTVSMRMEWKAELI